jgi:ankyrin repeat protein
MALSGALLIFMRCFSHTSISRLATRMLIALAWCSLLSCGGNHQEVSYKDVESLRYAVRQGDLEKVKVLLKKNPELVFKNYYGSVPLLSAVDAGQKDVAELLMAHGADVHAKEEDGLTPLHWAADSKAMVEFLLVHGADVNAKDEDGRTPLYWAAMAGDKDLAELLLAHKAEVNARDSQSWMPLYMAAQNKRKAVAELLRQYDGHQ